MHDEDVTNDESDYNGRLVGIGLRNTLQKTHDFIPLDFVSSHAISHPAG